MLKYYVIIFVAVDLTYTNYASILFNTKIKMNMFVPKLIRNIIQNNKGPNKQNDDGRNTIIDDIQPRNLTCRENKR